MSSTTSSSLASTRTTPCILNCQQGGTPEIENGCFCYCVEKTYGRECENSEINFLLVLLNIIVFLLVDCSQPDAADVNLCIPTNQLLCQQSEIFAYKCLYLCGKC